MYLIEEANVAMVTGKPSGEMVSYSKEFSKLAGVELSDMQSSAAIFLSRMGTKFGETLKQMTLSKSKERVVFWDSFRTPNGEVKCRFALSLLSHEDEVEGYQCVMIPQSELVE